MLLTQHMKNFTTLIFSPFAILVFLFSSGCKKSNAPVSNVNQPSRGILFEVSKTSNNRPGYIFVTQWIQPDNMKLIDKLDSIIGRGYRLGVSVDLSDIEVQEKYTSQALLPNNGSLQDFYSNAEWTKIVQYCNKMDVKISSYINFNPLTLLSLLESLFIVGNAEMDTYERYLIQFAEHHQQEVFGLESADELMPYLNLISLEEQAEMLLSYVSRDEEEINGELSKYFELEEMYLRQDLNAMYRTVNNLGLNLPRKSEEIKKEKLRLWLPVIEEKYSGTLFPIHINEVGGETGLIANLKNRGFKVKQIHL